MSDRNFRKELREVVSFHCTDEGDFSKPHKCVFNLIEDMLKEIDELRSYIQ